MEIVRLKEKLGQIPDHRQPWGSLRHKLEDILDADTTYNGLTNQTRCESRRGYCQQQ